MSELAINLKRCREAAGFSSSTALALKSGVGVATVKNIERGTNINPGLETLEKLANACVVSVSQITGVLTREETAEHVEAFLSSAIGIAADPSEEEKRWLRSLDVISLLGGKMPTPRTFFHFLEGRRESLRSQ